MFHTFQPISKQWPIAMQWPGSSSRLGLKNPHPDPLPTGRRNYQVTKRWLGPKFEALYTHIANEGGLGLFEGFFEPRQSAAVSLKLRGTHSAIPCLRISCRNGSLTSDRFTRSIV